jgi:hypothetical protein
VGKYSRARAVGDHDGQRERDAFHETLDPEETGGDPTATYRPSGDSWGDQNPGSPITPRSAPLRSYDPGCELYVRRD